jgi:hypothetical protein
MVRTCRCASARTCHICQVDRLCSIAAKTRPAVCATKRASTYLVASADGASAVCTIDATASAPSSTAASLCRLIVTPTRRGTSRLCGQVDPGDCLRASGVWHSGSLNREGGMGNRVKGIDCDRPTRRWWLRPVTHPWKRDQAMSQHSMRSLHLICLSRRCSAASESPIGAEDPST